MVESVSTTEIRKKATGKKFFRKCVLLKNEEVGLFSSSQGGVVQIEAARADSRGQISRHYIYICTVQCRCFE